MILQFKRCLLEEEMIELTGNAIKRFREYFNGKDLSPIRIYGQFA